MKVLFLGNSYTFFSDLPKLFEAAARSAGKDVQSFSATKGGTKLSVIADPATDVGAKAAAALAEGPYDVVFLQDHSINPFADPKDFRAGAVALLEKIRPTGAKVVLYRTWGRKKGHPVLEERGWTNETMTYGLGAAYVTLGKHEGIAVSPVGQAFFDVYHNCPETEIYDKDLTHPSLAGSYLAALCHFATVFGESPRKVTFVPEGVDEQTRAILVEAAVRATENANKDIPQEYLKAASVALGYTD